MGLPLLLIALVFHLNGVTWFSGENGVETACWWVGGILTGLTVLWFVIVALVGLFAVSRR